MMALNLDEVIKVDFEVLSRDGKPQALNLEPDFVLALGCPLDDEKNEVEHGT
jgi:hypothetical protein